MEKYEQITLKNGVRIVYERVPGVRSASLGIWVANGSRCETPAEAGVSHFIEHMLFKGTSTRSAAALAAEMDRFGGQFNAYTSKENTTFYFRTLDEYLPQAIDVLSDMFTNSLLLDRDMELERTVIYEEIDMVEDTPDDLVMDKLAQAVYPDHPLGAPIIGTRESLAPMTGAFLREYMKRHYVPENIVISLAGSFSDAILTQLSDTFSRIPAAPVPPVLTASYHAGECLTAKSIEQNHLCLAYPGCTYTAPERFSVQVLSNILGGGMSSRLFQKVREEAGLCYSIYSFSTTHIDTGMFGIYTGVSSASQARAESLIHEVIDDFLQHGPSDDELTRTRDQIKTSLLMGLESTMSRSNRLGQCTLFLGRVPAMEETIACYDAVTRDSVLETAHRLLGDRNLESRAVVGKI